VLLVDWLVRLCYASILSVPNPQFGIQRFFREQLGAQFYAHLYFEATGSRERARAKITSAADRYTAGAYMNDMAVVHRDILLHEK